MLGYGTAVAAALAAAYGPSAVATSALQSFSEFSVPLDEIFRFASLRLEVRVEAFLFGRRLTDILSENPAAVEEAGVEAKDSKPPFKGKGVLISFSQSSFPLGNCQPQPSLIARSSSPSGKT